jgi:tetratricopeptide (TPR) repeat protein
MLSPRALVSRLDGRLGRGVTASDRPDRHRTLDATMRWSYDLLSSEDQAFFREVAIFAGSADLDGIAAVSGDAGRSALDAVRRLAAANLVHIEEAVDGEPRVAMLSTVRAFARDRLAEADDADEVRTRHLYWCRDVVGRTVGLLGRALHTVALDRLAAMDNDIRAALDFALTESHDDPDRLAATRSLLIDATNRYWQRFGSAVEAQEWQRRALATTNEQDSESAVELLHGLGTSQLQQALVDEASELFERALQMAQRLGNDDLTARALNDLGLARLAAEEFLEAKELLERSLDVSARTGSKHYEALSLGDLAVVYAHLNEFAQAAQVAEKAMAADAATGDEWGLAIDRMNYTGAVLNSAGPAAAYARYIEWAPQLLTFRDTRMVIDLLEVGAAIAAGLHRPPIACQLLAVADAQRTTTGLPRPPSEHALIERWLAPARASVPQAQWQQAYDQGADLSPERAVALLQSIDALPS